MPWWIKRLALWLLGSTVVLVALIWIVLAAPFFSDLRRSVVQDYLSEAIGQSLLIETDVRAVVAGTTRLTVSDVLIPSEEIQDLNLAELKLLELDIDLFDLLGGEPSLDNIRIDGLRVDLIKQEDGTTSWSAPPADISEDPSEEPDSVHHDSGIITFLRNKNVEVASVTLNVENQSSGFEFLFDLEALDLKQVGNGAAVALSSQGTINGQPFSIRGDYPHGAMTSTSINMGGLVLNFDGQGISEEQGGGIAGQLTLDSGEIGDLFEILKLNRTMEGSGQLTARLVRQGTGLAIQDLQTVVNFQNGSEITLEGSADDLMASVDFDVTVSGRMFPEGQPPKKATELKELELTKFAANLVSEAGAVEVKEVLLETNYFESEFREIGPITVGQVRRTKNGGLALEDILAQIGPRETPYVTANGGILDLLKLEQLDFTGTLNAPASLVLPEFQNDTVQAFGGLVAEFEVSDASGQLSLSKLEAHSENSELWTMQATAAVRTVQSVEGVDLQLDLEVPDGAEFLSALQLEPVDVGPLGFSFGVKGTDGGLETQVMISAGQSRVNTKLNTVIDKAKRTSVRGSIRSERLNVDDLGNAAEAGLQLSSLDATAGSVDGGSPGRQNREIQPLVLESQEQETVADGSEEREDGRIVQPLVLEKADADAQAEDPVARNDGRVVQPLVLDDTAGPSGASGLLNLEQIGRDLDLEIAIEIEEITGQAGVSKISSALTSKDGKAELGPIEFGYGGGFFKIGAQIDFIDSPQLAHVFGATSGWDFGKILDDVGAGIKANGKLQAQFDLTGNYKSAQSFVNTMSGPVTISMVNGAIATSLLDLAGLGLFPWLFSKELQQGYTSIVCVVAPLRINGGKASSNAIVVETKSVQLVAKGSVDWANDRIALRAEPRPVGRPLARTAWPFEVTGRLSNPDFKIGGRPKTQNTPEGGGLFKKLRDGTSSQTQGADRTPCKPDRLQTQ